MAEHVVAGALGSARILAAALSLWRQPPVSGAETVGARCSRPLARRHP